MHSFTQVVNCFKGVVEKIMALPSDMAGTYAQIPPAQRPFYDASALSPALNFPEFCGY